MNKIKNILVCDGIKAELFESNGKFRLNYTINDKNCVYESNNINDVNIIINTLKTMKPINKTKSESITTKNDNIILEKEFGEERLDKVKNNFGDLLNAFSIQQRTNELIDIFPEADKFELKKIAELVISEGITDYKEFAKRKLMIDEENKVINIAKKKRPNKNDFINKGMNSSFSKDEINVGSETDFSKFTNTSKHQPKPIQEELDIVYKCHLNDNDYAVLCDELEDNTDNMVIIAYQEEELMEVAVMVVNDGKDIKLLKVISEECSTGGYDVVYYLKNSEAIEHPEDIDSVEAQEDRMIMTADNYLDSLLLERKSKETVNLDGMIEMQPDNSMVINAPKMGDDLIQLGQSKVYDIFEYISEEVANPDKELKEDKVFDGEGTLTICMYYYESDTLYTVNLNNSVPLYITKDKLLAEAAYKELYTIFKEKLQ